MKEIKLTSAALTQLYNDIGGEPALEKILKKFYQNMRGDLLIGFFFDGKDTDLIAQKQKEFLMRAWGITQSYAGKSPAAAHEALPPILRGHFDRRLVILGETLRGFGLSSDQVETWLNFENKFRQGIEREER